MKKAPRLIPSVVIENAGAEGKCIARHNNKVLLVEQAVPGDVADVFIHTFKKSYNVGQLQRVISPSPDRQEPFCKHFGACGGCKWQQMTYQAQLRYKQQQVQDAFERIGKFPFPPLEPILASAEQQYYRNKLEYTFTHRRWLQSMDLKDQLREEEHLGLGFHVPGRWDKVLDIEHCYHQPHPSNAIRLAVKEAAISLGLPFFNLVSQEGFMRQLIIRNSLHGEWMVIICFTADEEEQRKQLFERLIPRFPQVVSWMYVLNDKKNDSIYDLDVHLYHGHAYITEQMEELSFRIGPKSFFQTNSAQALELYRLTRDMAGLQGNELVYDLYTGVGTIANFVAKRARKVVGIEYIEQAVEDARLNSSINHISNTSFFAGDMREILNDSFAETQGKPDVIISDPPRAGMHEDVVKKILELAPQKLVYVSCNPATHARDIALMQDAYQVSRVQPVDMFPHTHHVENIALLEKK